MRFNIINNKLIFIHTIQFLSFSLESLVKNLGKDDFKYLNKASSSKLLDLIKQKGLYPHEYMSCFKKFKEELPIKEKFCNSFTGKKLMINRMSMISSSGIDLK